MLFCISRTSSDSGLLAILSTNCCPRESRRRKFWSRSLGRGAAVTANPYSSAAILTASSCESRGAVCTVDDMPALSYTNTMRRSEAALEFDSRYAAAGRIRNVLRFPESNIRLRCGHGIPVKVRRPKHHRGGVEHNDYDKPAHRAQRQGLDEKRGE